MRLGTVPLLYFCAHAVTGEVDIQLASDFHSVPHSTNIHCLLTICQVLQQAFYVCHILPPWLITNPDICLRSQHKPEFKFRSIPILGLFGLQVYFSSELKKNTTETYNLFVTVSQRHVP